MNYLRLIGHIGIIEPSASIDWIALMYVAVLVCCCFGCLSSSCPVVHTDSRLFILYARLGFDQLARRGGF